LAFLKALGAESLLEDGDRVESMERLGSVLRQMIIGMREVLMTRTAIKGEFRMNQTMIKATGNNPLKFSVSEDQAISAMVRTPDKGYLDPTDAVKEALDDIRAHEVAMVTGMQAALKGLLSQLDPQALAAKLEEGGGRGSLFKGKKTQYWEIYEKKYAEIAEQAENDFQDLFQNEFARAYEAQLKKLG
jgi:type VI secretion system protein ImpI/type VI secretion system protein